MAHSTLTLNEISKLQISDYGCFQLIDDWHEELREKTMLSRLFELLKSDSKKDFIQFLSKFDNRQERFADEIILSYQKGLKFSGYLRLTAYKCGDFDTQQILLFIRNISEEYSSYKKLLGLSLNIKDFVDYAPQSIVVAKEDKIEYASPFLTSITLHNEESIGQCSLENILPVLGSQTESNWKRKKNAPQSTTLLTKEGAVIGVDSYATQIIIRKQKFRAIIISETNSGYKSERKIIDYLEGFKNIADSLHDVLFQLRISIRGKFHFTYLSKGTEELLGVSAENLGQNPTAFIDNLNESNRNQVLKSFDDLDLESSQTWEEVFHFENETSVKPWIKLRAVISKDKSGLNIQGILSDITEEKEQIRKEQEMMDALIHIHQSSAVQNGDIQETYQIISEKITEILDAFLFRIFYIDESKTSVFCDYSRQGIIENEQKGEVYLLENLPLQFQSISSNPKSFLIINNEEASEEKSLSNNNSILFPIFSNSNVIGITQIGMFQHGLKIELKQVQFLRKVSDVISYCNNINEKKIFEQELLYLNGHLSQLVDTRTYELKEQQRQLESKNNEITSSIRYAQHIQNSILPNENYFNKLFKESLIIYEPKDIVAGDFYWVDQIQKSNQSETTLIAVCDCTGHGVPGAMMSMLASSALTRSVQQLDRVLPSEILSKSNEILKENILKSQNELIDGMHASICAVTPIAGSTKKTLSFAGANSRIWIYRKSKENFEIIELKGNKCTIGMTSNDYEFREYQIEVESGDLVYMFTDGMADQFGGGEGKKFKYRRLQEMITEVCELPMSIQKRCILSVFNQWKNGIEQVDDVLLIGWKV